MNKKFKSSSQSRKYSCRHIFILILLLIMILIIKKTFLFQTPQLWAEDATVFFKQAHEMGIGSLIHSYNGYIHLLPRLIAYITIETNYLYIPFYYLFSSLTITLFVSYYLFTSNLSLSLKQRFILALLVVGLPSNGEIFLNIANLQWILAPLLIILLIENPENYRIKIIYKLSLISLISLTSLLGVIFFPIALIRYLVHRDKYSLLISVVLGATGLIQLLIYTFSPRESSHAMMYYADWLKMFFISLSNYAVFVSMSPYPYLLIAIAIVLLIIFSQSNKLTNTVLFLNIFILMCIV